jgi:hypothetical protein
MGYVYTGLYFAIMFPVLMGIFYLIPSIPKKFLKVFTGEEE